MSALQEIVQAVLSGRAVVRVGHLGHPRIVLSGVDSDRSRSAVEVGARLEDHRGGVVPLRAWY